MHHRLARKSLRGYGQLLWSLSALGSAQLVGGVVTQIPLLRQEQPGAIPSAS